MPSLTLACTVVLADQVMAAALDDNTALLDPVSGEYAALNPIGSLVVARLDGQTSIDALCDQLCATHQVEPGVCRTDVLEFLDSLDRKGFLVRR